ncbi:hypothetical protein EDB81DRAFT_771653 [Dactylonectria macrodidyma]|uniref:NACHT-NTPase and P-loop NTPases N-terminal domain-containing protein n=1 Tax=Dactylonectria macrodidyma TaxID=307937 RepID=A0A9P9FRL8_9HYPO|nr:hypothetical protein EDB81DRAFT_771653 [Dactylonectria macrodidyma]
MSGAEVIGLISGITAIIETITKVYSSLKDANNLPAFREVLERLPLVRDTLRTAGEHVGGNADEHSCQSIKKILEKCRDKAERLETILKEVAPSEDTPRFERYRMAVRRLGKGNQVEVLTKEMMEAVRLLVENHVVKAATEAQVAQLLKAIEDLSAMEPSVPDEDSSVTYNHYGQGGQNILAGSGSQYNNTGEGKQYNAQTMHFARD